MKNWYKSYITEYFLEFHVKGTTLLMNFRGLNVHRILSILTRYTKSLFIPDWQSGSFCIRTPHFILKIYLLLKNTEDKIYEAAIDSYNIDDGLLVLQTNPALKPKMKYTLNIEYYGDLQRMSYGLFQISNSNYTNSKDEYVE